MPPKEEGWEEVLMEEKDGERRIPIVFRGDSLLVIRWSGAWRSELKQTLLGLKLQDMRVRLPEQMLVRPLAWTSIFGIFATSWCLGSSATGVSRCAPTQLVRQ